MLSEPFSESGMQRFGVTILLLAAAAACRDANAPANDVDAVQVSVRVDPQIVVAGSAATVFVTLRNPLPRAVEVSSCATYFWIQNGRGDVVAGSRAIFCALVARSSLVYIPLRLKPFEARTLEYTWPGTETQAVPLGQYFAYGWFNDAEHISTPAQLSVVVTAAP